MIENTLIKIADNYSLSKLSNEELTKRGFSREIIKEDIVRDIRQLNREEDTIFYNISLELREKLTPFSLDDFFTFIDEMNGNSDKDLLAKKLRRTIMLLNDIIIEYTTSFRNNEELRKTIMLDMEQRILDLLTITSKEHDVKINLISTPMGTSPDIFGEEFREISQPEMEIEINSRIIADLERMGNQYRGTTQ